MIFVNTEGTKKTIADKVNVTDVLIDINKSRISFEMNKEDSEKLRKRNKAHLFSEAYKTINIGYREGITNYFFQINFDNFMVKDKLITTYKITDIDDGTVDEDNENFIKL